MLWVPARASEFAWTVSNVSGLRPANSLGATITPAENTKGAWTEVLAAADVTRDVFGLFVNFNSNSASTSARDTICDVGVDPSGGTSYAVLIPDLLASCATHLAIGVGHNYYFPIWIRAGSSVAVRASVNNATVGTLRCIMQAWGSPRDARMVRVGTYVVALGITAASSSGTTVVSGTTSEGAWTSLSTGLPRPAWWWQLGMGINDSTMGANKTYHADLSIGDGTNNRIVVLDQRYSIPDGNETLSDYGTLCNTGYDVSSGNVYGRLQCSSTPDSALSLAAYGLGG